MKARIALILAIVLSTSGCVAVELSKLQSDYYGLVGQKAAWSARKNAAGGPPGGKETLNLEGDVLDGEILEIAKQAEKAGDEAKDTRNRLALYRLATVAAWQAGPIGYDDTIKISQKGQQACKSVKENEFGAPRDCALLTGVSVLAESDRVEPRITKLHSLLTPTGLPADQFQEVQQVKSELDNVVANLDSVSSRILPMPGLDPSVTAYFALQRYRIHCNYYAFYEVAVTIKDPSPPPSPAKPEYAQLRDSVKKSFCPLHQSLDPKFANDNCGGPGTIPWATVCP